MRRFVWNLLSITSWASPLTTSSHSCDNFLRQGTDRSLYRRRSWHSRRRAISQVAGRENATGHGPRACALHVLNAAFRVFCHRRSDRLFRDGRRRERRVRDTCLRRLSHVKYITSFATRARKPGRSIRCTHASHTRKNRMQRTARSHA